MKQLTDEIKQEIKDVVYDFFAEECEADKADLNEDTLIVEDLDGDSLLFVELVEVLKKKYSLDIQLQTIGKYLIKHPADTIKEILETSYLLYVHENDLINLEK